MAGGEGGACQSDEESSRRIGAFEGGLVEGLAGLGEFEGPDNENIVDGVDVEGDVMKRGRLTFTRRPLYSFFAKGYFLATTNRMTAIAIPITQ